MPSMHCSTLHGWPVGKTKMEKKINKCCITPAKIHECSTGEEKTFVEPHTQMLLKECSS
ncbi:hypothetical protein GBF38_019877 [Nibea albiflora]|uniref:Uncharacterized protein n=1 Tax=Nibea albiflora TaxID=240163 RepID=A0ACB7FAA8_NIBAL|nr:hypothetical protein GBF38_019877 [Nibea albiflora]